MLAERGLHALLEAVPGNGIAGQLLQQTRRFVDEAGGAVAALEGEMIDECLLDVGKPALLRMPLDGPYPRPGELRGTVDATLSPACQIARAAGQRL